MAISIQGGLYASCAYSTVSSNGEPATLEDTCASGTGGGGRVQAAAAAKGDKVEAKQGGNVFGDLLTTILNIASNELGSTCFGKKKRTTPPPTTKTTPKVEAKVAYNSGEHEEEQLYSGIALIISGPFYETSKHDGKIAETGIMEFAPIFDGFSSAGSHPINNWPVVKPQSAKLRFTQEDQYYGSDAKSQRK